MDPKEQSTGKDQLYDAVTTDRSGLRFRNFDFDELGGSLHFSGPGFAPPVQKTLVAELMLTAKFRGTKIGLVKLCEPVLALLLGKSSRRHAEQNTSVDPLGEIIQTGLIGPLRKAVASSSSIWSRAFLAK